MNRSALLCVASLLLGLGGSASADILHLRNGRTMEGKVVAQKKGMVHLKVPGGSLVIPMSTVKRIEERVTPQQEYARRAQRTDMSDPVALDALAHWASGRGLGDRAIQLREQAKGLRLQAKVDAIRESKLAGPFVALHGWAVAQDYSTEVQRWLLEEALEREPKDVVAQTALAAHERRTAPRVEAATPKVEALETVVRELEAQREESERLRARLEAVEQEKVGPRHVIAVPNRRRRRHRRSPYFVYDPLGPEACAAREAAWREAAAARRLAKQAKAKQPIRVGLMR